MSSPAPADIRNQIERLTSDIIGLSLCNDQKFPSVQKLAGQITEVGFRGDNNLSVALKNIPYTEIYNELERVQAYNVKMLDGALIQFLYRFKKDELIKHQLAFFPSPHLDEYQNNPDIYENDEIYAEVIKRNIVPFPLRIDYDTDADVVVELDHPMSHLTLGQYKNCRIPVSAPVTPYIFVNFILRNFYNTAFKTFCDKIQKFDTLFSDTLVGREKGVLHFQVPREKLT